MDRTMTATAWLTRALGLDDDAIADCVDDDLDNDGWTNDRDNCSSEWTQRDAI